MKTKKLTYAALLTASALILSYIERLLPLAVSVPGAKIGLANIATVMALYLLGPYSAFCIVSARVLLAGFMFSGMSSIIYALCGGIVSFLIMWAMKSMKLPVICVSVTGGIAHNLAQLCLAALVLNSTAIFSYLPVLLLYGVIAGAGIGVTSRLALGHIGPPSSSSG